MASPRKRPRRRPTTRGAALSLAVLELGCARPTPHGQGAPAPTTVASTPTTTSSDAPPATSAASSSASAATPAPPPVDDAAALARLATYGVSDDRVARAVLYTWTTQDQIDELAKDRVLLTRTESPTRGPSNFDRQLIGGAAGGDPIAALLRTKAFARARHAWAAPWATLLGWEGETYGERLLRVTLKPEAWILELRATAKGWRAFDLANAPVPMEEVQRHPERIAAVYFVNDIWAASRGGTYAAEGGAPVYREYVLCNEAMILAWSVDTDAIARELAEAAETVDAFARTAPSAATDLGEWAHAVAAGPWAAASALGSSVARYEAALAFPNDRYAPTPANLATLAARLRAIRAPGPPIVHQPSVKFARDALVPVDGRTPRPSMPRVRSGTH